MKHETNHNGVYAFWLAQQHAELGDAAQSEQVLQKAPWINMRNSHSSRGSTDIWSLHAAFQAIRTSEEVPPRAKQSFYETVAKLRADWPSSQAELALIEADPPASPMARLLAYQRPTRKVHYDSTRWDQLMPYAQEAFNRGDYMETAALVTGMLTNITGAGGSRQQTGRDMVARCYARIGSVGLTIDETSPVAPLLQAALYLRLGDQRMAFDAYSANKPLFDKHRDELPADLVLFVCNQLIAASGQENHDKVEEVVRGWIIKNSESKQIEDSLKARFQLLLAKNYFASPAIRRGPQ